MQIFMAGGVSGNLKPFWKDTCEIMQNGVPFNNAKEDAMKIFLAGEVGESRHWIQDELLESQKKKNENLSCREWDFPIIHRPGNVWGGHTEITKTYRPYILESFFYCDADTERLLPYFGDFMLDSGAFTFMQGKNGQANWESYLERYIDFINRNKVGKFFELDIDSVVGYETVKRFRRKIERDTGRQPIPVWHNNRGKEEFVRHCQEYDYVAIGGLVGGASEYSKKYWKYFPWFINTAHQNNTKIHALGFTSLKGIETYHFDSVDSTAWTTGNRFGYIYYFDGRTMKKKDAPKGYKLGNSRAVALNNYREWIKFQIYADKHL